MRTVRLEDQIRIDWPAPVVTIGNFDGVHRGHAALVAATVERARARQGTAVVLTFEPHPARVLSPDRAPSALCTLSQKEEILIGLGVDRMAVLSFTRAVARLSAEEFGRKLLAERLRARTVVVGENFRFGRGREGDISTLRSLGAILGFEVVAIPAVTLEGEPVSSSRVRDALARGDVGLARALLGRAFFVDGRVVHGDGRGMRIGVPTANLATENETLPEAGVYAGWCRLPSGEAMPAVINRGRRPTFGPGAETLEAHLLGFEGDIYDAHVRVSFEARLREERRFDGPEALVAQIHEDVERARAILASAGGNGV
jgi:riboflavin kinase/FMN adenylyltransferase